MRILILSAIAAITLAACQSTTQSNTVAAPNPIRDAIVGKTLKKGDILINVNADGTTSGAAEANWTLEGDLWCDDNPKGGCFQVELVGDKLSFLKKDGSKSTYTIIPQS